MPETREKKQPSDDQQKRLARVKQSLKARKRKGNGRKFTDIEQTILREQVESLHLDMGASQREIAAQLNIGSSTVCKILKAIQSEYRQAPDPERRNEHINIQIRHHKFVISRFFHEAATHERGTKGRKEALTKLSEALVRYERCLTSFGVIPQTPSELKAELDLKGDIGFEANPELVKMVESVFGNYEKTNQKKCPEDVPDASEADFG